MFLKHLYQHTFFNLKKLVLYTVNIIITRTKFVRKKVGNIVF